MSRILHLFLVATLMLFAVPADSQAFGPKNKCKALVKEYQPKITKRTTQNNVMQGKLKGYAPASNILKESWALSVEGKQLLGAALKKGKARLSAIRHKCKKERQKLGELEKKLNHASKSLLKMSVAMRDSSLRKKELEGTIYVLALDGGGVRGIIGARLIQEIEEKTGKKITELFDYFAGTSTGGLMALLMNLPNGNGKQRYSGKNAVAMYQNLSKVIFSGKAIDKEGESAFKKKWRNFISKAHKKIRDIKTLKGTVRSKFSAKPLEALLKSGKYFGSLPMNKVIKPMFIVSWDAGEQKPFVFYSENTSAAMWEAGRATSAAPTYFKAFDYRGHVLQDGGLTDNSPGVVALAKIKSLHPGKEVVIISFGTGYHPRSSKPQTTGVFSGGIAQSLKGTIADLFAASEIKAHGKLKTSLGVNYVRVTPVLGRNIDLADAKSSTMNELLGYARTAIASPDFKKAMVHINRRAAALGR